MIWDHVLLWTRGLGFATAAGLFWLQYFDLKDYLNPEPRRMLLVSFLFGAAAAGAGLVLYFLVGIMGGPEEPGNTRLAIYAYCLLIVGPIEEGTKFLAARLSAIRSIHFDEPIDGLIYSSAVSIGFASVESLIYTPLLEWPYQLARSLTAPLTHSLFSCLWGFGAGYALFRPRNSKNRRWLLTGSLAAAMIVHGSYDYLLLAHNATWIASLMALSLWIALIAYARAIVRKRVHGNSHT